MKQFTKICLVICIMLGILGSALCVAAFSLGASIEDVEEMIADGEFQIGEGMIDAKKIISNTQNVEKNFSKIDSLKIEVGVEEVAIYVYDGDEIQVKAENVTSTFQCTQSGKTLKIKDEGPKINLNIFSERRNSKIDIYLPETWELKELDLEVGVGSVETEEITVESLNIDCGVGSVYFRGNVKTEGKVECGIGEVKMDLSGEQTEYNYKMECGVGSIQIGDDYESSIPGKKYIDNNAKKEFAIECGIGSVKIEFI